MSSFFSFFFIFLFCLSVHLCSARHFGVLVGEGFAPQIHFSGKGSAEEVKTTDGDSNINVGKIHGGVFIHKAAVGKGGVSRMNSKSLVWVSWRVPHKIHEGHAVFFSDYSRPQTRPPSHN